jgi:hypothetical protein
MINIHLLPSIKAAGFAHIAVFRATAAQRA